jgi:hypothetical protein
LIFPDSEETQGRKAAGAQKRPFPKSISRLFPLILAYSRVFPPFPGFSGKWACSVVGARSVKPIWSPVKPVRWAANYMQILSNE